MKRSFCLILLALTLLPFGRSWAGVDVGNGGDICEDRFKVARDDISSWLRKGGSAGLDLSSSNDVSLAQYNAEMLLNISGARVSCTDGRITIGKAEKTCKNFREKDGSSVIVCNSRRFMATAESDQYVLVHHEYAGLSGFEVNDGEDSKYFISNQIAGYLVDQVVKKLAIIRPDSTIKSKVFTGNAFFTDGGKGDSCKLAGSSATESALFSCYSDGFTSCLEIQHQEDVGGNGVRYTCTGLSIVKGTKNGAIIVARQSTYTDYGTGDSCNAALGAARNSALKDCVSQSGQNCTEIAWAEGVGADSVHYNCTAFSAYSPTQ